MKSYFLSLLAVAATSLALAQAPGTEITDQELAQGYRQQVVLARPLPSERTKADAAEIQEGTLVREKFSLFRDLRIIEVPAGDDVAAVVARLQATGRYEFVEPDYIRHVEMEPSDPQFASGALWALKNNGASNGVVGADIHATAAWDIVHDAPGVVVAVIDTGVNINHEDLAGNIWVNPAPTFGDVNGARFINRVRGTNIIDDNGHGTHVAGTIGAVGNNSLDVAGIAWRVQIMPVKIFGSSGSGSVSDIVEGVKYAVEHGAHIINASYGESGTSGFTPSGAELAAIQGARDAGVIFVAAAGNDGLNIDATHVYPANHGVDNILAVGASTRRDELAPFSNYGSGVDLFAPGSEIISLAFNANTGTSNKSGTSMAAPHVAGALALIKARFPDDNYRQLINRLLRGVDRGDRFIGKSQTGGRLNVFNALNTTTNRPFNDDLADRPRLTGENLKLRASNAGATAEAGEPAVAGVNAAPTIWWEWSPATTGIITVDTAGSNQDTVLGVYTSTSTNPSPANLTLVAENDNDGALITSKALFTAQAGVKYYIAAASKTSGGGLVLLNLNTSPANDQFSNATQITGVSAQLAGHNANATAEAGEPAVLGFRGGHTLWYRWVAPKTGRVQIAVASPEFDPLLGVFTGSSVTGLTMVAQNDNIAAGHTDSLCTVEAAAGTTYWILVDSKTAATGGQFTLTLVDSLWQGPTLDNVTGSPAVGPDGTVYVGSTDDYVYAFNSDGTLKWSNRTGGLIDTCSPAVAADGSVYIGSYDGIVYAYSSTGVRKWTRNFGSASPMSNSPAVAADGTIYIKAGDGYLYAMDPATGVSIWRYNVHGLETYASPVIGRDGTIYQGSDDANLYAINPDGTLKWVQATDNDVYTAPAIDAQGNVYVGVLSTGYLYSFTPSGTRRWVYTGATLGTSSSPAVSADGSTVYFAGYDNLLHAVYTATGQQRWTYELGNEVRASSPAIDANGVIYIGCYDGKLYAINPDGSLKRTYDTGDWIRSSPAIAGTTLYVGSNDAKLYAFDIGAEAASGPWPQYRQNARRLGRTLVAPTITTQPSAQVADAGASVTLTTATSGSGATYQWLRNGANVTSATSPSLNIPNLQPNSTGVYQDRVSGETTTATDYAIVGLTSSAKAIGTAFEFAADIVHQNRNVYDQVLLTGPSASITADPGQIVRLSYVDLSKDIVQVEFSGAGTLSINLDNASGPAPAQNYVQPDVSYMQGHASIVVAGADETTNLTIFSVGRATAVNQSLFRSDVTYDGMADLAYIAIESTNGRFGGLRTGNASFFNTRGITGVYAPGVQFTGPVVIGDISASDSAQPMLIFGSTTTASIAGGNLLQTNGQSVRVSGITSLQFIAGTTSQGTPRPAQANRARLEQNGVEVTSTVVVNPKP